MLEREGQVGRKYTNRYVGRIGRKQISQVEGKGYFMKKGVGAGVVVGRMEGS